MLGELVQTITGKWITHPPARCPNGHPLGPGDVLVGHQTCLGHGGGHTTWTCRTCDETVYGPPMNTHCAALDGPAAVRISTASYTGAYAPSASQAPRAAVANRNESAIE
jgi:hypothetical protein